MRCAKAIANHKAGLREIMATEKFLGALLTTFKWLEILDQKLVLEILTFMCYVNQSEGHTLVLRALNHFMEEKKKESRFDEIILRLSELSHESFDVKEALDERVIAEFQVGRSFSYF